MKAIFNRAPLLPNTLAPLPLGRIRPEGWLKDQLRTQADGFTGTLHDIWPDVGDNGAWLGGEGDGWERAPYYLDGLVPLAYTLNDDKLKALAQRYIDWMLASQREDGWFGPEKNEDYWPLMVALKALRSYFTATGDKRVLTLMDKFFRYEYKNIEEKPLRGWAVARGAENIELVEWMYNISGQKYLLELGRRLREQTLDWANEFHTFPHQMATSRSLKWDRLQEGMADEKKENDILEGTNRPYFQTQYHFTHGVNVAMGLKAPGVFNQLKSGFKEQDGFRFGYSKLMKYHGVASGLFTCDEHLNGANPSQGTETCTVVELMYSLETLIGLGGDVNELGDILEKVTFNALPAAFTADMTGHQYDQQVNQIEVSKRARKWYNNEDDSNVYGFEPNFGCCTANAHQGWPKFAASLWYATDDDGLAAVSYAPCTVSAAPNGVPVRVKVSGSYPFETSVPIEISVKQPVEFALYLRIPAWARQPMITLPNGEILFVRAGETACIRRKWVNGDKVLLELPAQPKLTRWYHQSAAVELGPLLMELQPEEEWATAPNGDRWVRATSEWNWALVPDEPMKAVYEGGREVGFGKCESPVTVLVKAVPIEWAAENGSAANIPMAPKPLDEPEILRLVPYGDTGLRIAQFPLANMKKG